MAPLFIVPEKLRDMPKKLTQEEFIERARTIHGDKYSYDKVIYVNGSTPVTIICDVHGEFKQTPNGHLSGKGCKACGYIRNRTTIRKTTEYFIERARKKHGDKYDYSRVVYKGADDPVEIICPRHGSFGNARLPTLMVVAVTNVQLKIAIPNNESL